MRKHIEAVLTANPIHLILGMVALLAAIALLLILAVLAALAFVVVGFAVYGLLGYQLWKVGYDEFFGKRPRKLMVPSPAAEPVVSREAMVALVEAPEFQAASLPIQPATAEDLIEETVATPDPELVVSKPEVGEPTVDHMPAQQATPKTRRKRVRKQQVLTVALPPVEAPAKRKATSSLDQMTDEELRKHARWLGCKGISSKMRRETILCRIAKEMQSVETNK